MVTLDHPAIDQYWPKLYGFNYSLCDQRVPPVERVPGHPTWWVARDDLTLGGTKSRVLTAVLHALGWSRGQPAVYAGPAQGGMQIALAVSTTVDAHLFYGERRVKGLHPRQKETLKYGAHHHYSPYPSVRPTQVKAFAKRWSEEHGATRLAWGLAYREVLNVLANLMEATFSKYGRFDEVWVAGGSGTLATGLKLGATAARSNAVFHVVPIGRTMHSGEAMGCVVHESPSYPMDRKVKTAAPFPCDPYYDGKAWEYAVAYTRSIREDGWDENPSCRRLFWNVIAPPQED